MIQRGPRASPERGAGLSHKLAIRLLVVHRFRRWYYAPFSLLEWLEAYAKQSRALTFVGMLCSSKPRGG